MTHATFTPTFFAALPGLRERWSGVVEVVGP